MAEPDKLSIVVHAGDYGRVHYALAMASAAAAMNKPVTLFFTMGAIRALAKDEGWRALPAGDVAPGKTGGEQDAAMVAKGLAGFEELLDACAAFKVKLLVCEMGLRAVGLTRGDLRDDLAFEDGGIVSFLADASATGQTLFV
ncbi:MAG: DsrE family protein [Alphaproteobacteria bacterium]